MLNESLAKQLVQAANWVKLQTDEGVINPLDILRWPGVMAAPEQDLDAINTQLIQARWMARWMISSPHVKAKAAL